MLAANTILQSRYRVVRKRRRFATSKSPRDQVREAIEQEKHQKMVDEIVKRSHVQIAEDCAVSRAKQ